jgi:hypothetical protein
MANSLRSSYSCPSLTNLSRPTATTSSSLRESAHKGLVMACSHEEDMTTCYFLLEWAGDTRSLCSRLALPSTACTHTGSSTNKMNSENGDESLRANCTCILALFITKWNQQRSHGEHRDYLKAGSSRPLWPLRAVRWTCSSVFTSRLLDLTRRPPLQDVCHAHHSPFCTTQHAMH